MTDQRSDAPHKGPGENPELREESDAREFDNTSTTGEPLTKSTGDQVGGQSEHSEKEQVGTESGLSEDDEQDWEEQEAIEGVNDAGGDRGVDERLSDDKEG